MNRRIKILLLIILLSISITNVFATELKKEQEAKHNPVSQQLSVPLFMEHRKIKESSSYEQLFTEQRPIYKINYDNLFEEDHRFNYHGQQSVDQKTNNGSKYFLIVLSAILLMLITFALTNRTIRKRKNMKVKISVIDDKNKHTIKVDASNNLEDILEVLSDNGLIESHGNVVYSKRIGRNFNIERTVLIVEFKTEMSYMSIKVKISSNELNAKNTFEFDLITKNQSYFANAKYRISNDSIIFIYDVDEEDILSNKKLTKYEKLIVLYNVLKLYDSADYLYFGLNPENIIVDENLEVKILNRDIPYQGYNNFINMWKALLGFEIDEKYNYIDYLNGGLDLLKNNKFLIPYFELNDVEQIKEQLAKDIKEYRELQTNKYMSVTKTSYRNNKIVKIILSTLFIAILIVSVVLGIKLTKSYKINQMQTYFIQEQYSDVISEANAISINDLTKADKYVIAYSYVKLETLPQNILSNLINNININSNENFLDYWVYLARNDFESANDEALSLNDQNLLVYSYLKEIDYITNSGSYSSSEKDKKIKELEGKIKEAGYDVKG